MDIPTTTVSAPSGTSNVRKAATPRTQASQRGLRFSLPFLGLLIAALVGGGLAGRLVERQHHRSAQVVASINGDVINSDELFGRLQSAAGENMMRGMATERLQIQYATKLGVCPTIAQAEAIYTQKSKLPGFLQNMAAQNLKHDDIVRKIRMEVAESQIYTKGIEATEAEAKSFYATQTDPNNKQARYYSPESAQVAVIITSTEATAQQALRDLHIGRGFDLVVRDYSQDTSKMNGGMLPLMERNRTNTKNLPGLEDAVFHMKIGEQLGPQKFGKSWWVIRCLDRHASFVQPYEDVKAECLLGAKLMKVKPERVQEIVKDFGNFKRASAITAFWPQYAPALKP